MEIIDYHTVGGKNVILDYIESLPVRQKVIALEIRKKIREEGILALNVLSTRHIRGKLYEIRFSNQRIFYVILNENSIYFLHICKKEKNKTEVNDLRLATRRAKELRYRF